MEANREELLKQIAELEETVNRERVRRARYMKWKSTMITLLSQAVRDGSISSNKVQGMLALADRSMSDVPLDDFVVAKPSTTK